MDNQIKQSINQWTKPIKWWINQWTDQSIDQSIDRSNTCLMDDSGIIEEGLWPSESHDQLVPRSELAPYDIQLLKGIREGRPRFRLDQAAFEGELEKVGWTIAGHVAKGHIVHAVILRPRQHIGIGTDTGNQLAQADAESKDVRSLVVPLVGQNFRRQIPAWKGKKKTPWGKTKKKLREKNQKKTPLKKTKKKVRVRKKSATFFATGLRTWPGLPLVFELDQGMDLSHHTRHPRPLTCSPYGKTHRIPLPGKDKQIKRLCPATFVTLWLRTKSKKKSKKKSWKEKFLLTLYRGSRPPGQSQQWRPRAFDSSLLWVCFWDWGRDEKYLAYASIPCPGPCPGPVLSASSRQKISSSLESIHPDFRRSYTRIEKEK